MTIPIVYEVNLQVEPQIEVAYLSWLKEHIQAILQQPGFIDATLYATINNPGAFVVQYLVASEQDLENYIHHVAPSMRQDGIDRFGNQFQATRRVLKPLG